MKKLISIIIGACVLFACSEVKKEQTDRNKHTKDTHVTIRDTIDKSSPDSLENGKILTEDFSILIRYIDSCGYLFDTSRFKKTYRDVKRKNEMTVDTVLLSSVENIFAYHLLKEQVL